MLIELNACMNSRSCPQVSHTFIAIHLNSVQMVTFYGAMFREGNVWICMEVMDISLDKFYKKCAATETPIPEPFVAKVALSLIDGLSFMKNEMNLIHR